MSVSNQPTEFINCATIALGYERTSIVDTRRVKEHVMNTHHLNVKVPIVATVSNVEIGFVE
jgi:hypothetical protein